MFHSRLHLFLDGFCLESEFSAQEQKDWAAALCNHHYQSYDLWAEVARVLPRALPYMADRLLEEFTTTHATFKKHSQRGWSPDWATSRVENVVDGMKVFVGKHPTFAVPFMTRLLRARANRRFVTQFVKDRQLDWKPHLRTFQSWFSDSISVPTTDIQIYMESGLWKHWLVSCLVKVRDPEWVLRKSIDHIPLGEVTHWQERFFLANKTDVAMMIAKRFPESPGPGRDHIRILGVHDQ